MDFRTATERATAGNITLADIAKACDVSLNTVERARMPLESGSSRPAPSEWEAAIAKLARKRALELMKLAKQLER